MWAGSEADVLFELPSSLHASVSLAMTVPSVRRDLLI
jgi:hypothetical protein